MFFFQSLMCASKAMSRYIKSCMCIWCETIRNYEGHNRSAVGLWKESLEEDVTYHIEHYRWCTLNTVCVCMCVCAKHFLKVKCILKNSFKWPTWVLCCGSEPQSYWRKKPQACADGPWRAESDWWLHLRPCADSLDAVPILVVREILSRTPSSKSCPATDWACMTQLLSTCASPHGLCPTPPHPQSFHFFFQKSNL